MTDLLREALNAFAAVLQDRAMQDKLARDIVNDNRGLPPTTALGNGGAAARCSVVGSPVVVDAAAVTNNLSQTSTHGYGWADTPKVGDWKPPGINIIDAMMDRQDRIDRMERRTEQLKANIEALANERR